MNKGEKEGNLDIIGYFLEHYKELDVKFVATKDVIKDLQTIKKVVESK